MSASETPPRPVARPAGLRVPVVLVRVALGAVALALCLAGLPGGILQLLGLALAAAAVLSPGWLTAWALILLLAAVRLAQPSSGLDAGLLALIAGLHAVHVLAALSMVLPVRGWLQLRALRRPALRYLVIQAVVQGFAVIVLLLLDPGGTAALTLPIAVLAGAAALLGTVVVLGRLARVERD